MPDPFINPPKKPHPSPAAVVNLMVRIVALLAVLAALLFVPAGRIDWTEAWVFIIGYGAFLLLYALWGLWKDPAQLRERGRAAPNAKSWDKVILGLYTVCLLLVFITAGMDAGRLKISVVPPVIEGLGWLGQLAAGAVIFRAAAANTYLSRVARIQEDRGQTVVTAGPYRWVRHPMYAGIILLFASIPPALGSWWAFVPGAAVAVLFVVRTAKEDRMLRSELAGYPEYAARVRYRLLPGVW
jgi:protein-S-isoprenylcysteine O-methyltransferase Ste14